MLDKIKTILQADSNVNSALNYIGLENAPQEVQLPYAVLSLVDGEPSDTKNSVSKMDISTISIDVYAPNLYTNTGGATGAYAIQELIETALDGYDDTVDGTRLYCRRMSVISTININIPNREMKNAECEYQVYVTKI